MKTIYSTLISLLLVTLAFANPKITAIANNGSWKNNSTWDLNRKPMNGDTVIIPAGIQVILDDIQNIPTSFLFIRIYGTLILNGGSLYINASSSLVLQYGGKLWGMQVNNEEIRIGGVQKYRTDVDGPLTGPKVANSATSSSPSGFMMATPQILPVKFIGFNIAFQNNNVLVQWSTAEELNSSYYEVQRSENGSAWSTVATVNAAGTTTSEHSYSYTDKNVTAKIIYYRIRQVDIDGQFVITPIRSLKKGNVTEIKISNASANSVYVHFSDEQKTNVLVSITSLSGQSIAKQTLSHPVGQVMVQTHTTSHGAYIVTVNDGNGLSVSKQILL